MKIRAFGRVLILIDEPELDFGRQKGGFRGAAPSMSLPFSVGCSLICGWGTCAELDYSR